MNSALPSIVLIGSGNLATNLGLALQEAGFPITQVYSRTEAHAQALAERLHAKWTTQPGEIVTQAQLYIVALKDSVLEELLPEIVKNRENSFFVHTAGSVSLEIWKKIPALKHYGVLYPLQTFSKALRADFRSIPLLIEASTPEDSEKLKSIADRLSTKVQVVTSAQRQALHLAAVFACNFSNHCYSLAAELLEEHHLKFELMLPLIDETARKIHTLAPWQAQSGPAVRYDQNIMGKHLEILEGRPELQTLYRLMSQSIHEKSLKHE